MRQIFSKYLAPDTSICHNIKEREANLETQFIRITTFFKCLLGDIWFIYYIFFSYPFQLDHMLGITQRRFKTLSFCLV